MTPANVMLCRLLTLHEMINLLLIAVTPQEDQKKNFVTKQSYIPVERPRDAL